MNTPCIDNKLDALRSTYLQKMPEKVDEVDQLIQRLDDPSVGINEVLQNLYAALHKFVGSSGIYGFSQIASVAGIFLEYVRIRKGHNYIKAPEKAQLQALFQELKVEVLMACKPEEKTALGYAPQLPGLGRSIALNSHRGSVFVVDDDHMQSRMVDFSLKQAGYEVTVFDSLLKLKHALKSEKPDAIIMDMMFPEGELAGADFISTHRDMLDENLPIFFLSTRRDMDARLAATRAGATRYFAKPVDMRSVIKAIEKSRQDSKKYLGNILIVDDDLPTAQFIGAKLKEANIEAEVLTDPLLILDAIECINPDLIMVDYYMPGCDGLELAAIVRQHELYYDMPIVFLTSEAESEVELAALNLGSDDFFNKALETEKLVKAVEARLKRIKSSVKIKRTTV